MTLACILQSATYTRSIVQCSLHPQTLAQSVIYCKKLFKAYYYFRQVVTNVFANRQRQNESLLFYFKRRDEEHIVGGGGSLTSGIWQTNWVFCEHKYMFVFLRHWVYDLCKKHRQQWQEKKPETIRCIKKNIVALLFFAHTEWDNCSLWTF